MPAIALADGHSDVQCTDGVRGDECGSGRWFWNDPLLWHTGEASHNNFFIGGKRVAVEGDRIAPHPDGEPCVSDPEMHEPRSSQHAANFFVGGKRALRVGSKFNEGTPFDHTITTGVDAFVVGGPDHVA